MSLSITCPTCHTEVFVGLQLRLLSGRDPSGSPQLAPTDPESASEQKASASVLPQIRLNVPPLSEGVGLRTRPKPKPLTYEDQGFQAFYKVYPRHAGKKNALRQYEAALRLVEADVILEGAKRYARLCKRNNVEQRHIVYPERWLSGRRWEDEDEEQPFIDNTPAIGTPEWQALQDEDLRRLREEGD